MNIITVILGTMVIGFGVGSVIIKLTDLIQDKYMDCSMEEIMEEIEKDEVQKILKA